VTALAHEAAVPVAAVGIAGGDAFASGQMFQIPLSRLREAWEGWMPAFMDAPS
jgi:phosphoribosylformylglycinamidine synthase